MEGSEEDGDESEGGEQRELTRVERRELKKKQAAQKQVGEEDLDFINPNHIEKKMNISDLGAPRELSRRER